MKFRQLNQWTFSNSYIRYSFCNCARIIPIHKGYTNSPIKNSYWAAVYPCVYREHLQFSNICLLAPGLSLCIQGTHLFHTTLYLALRFIPVYTGNTENKYWRNEGFAVYPCVYREHQTFIPTVSGGCGLSLCIQGTRKQNNPDFHVYWFIPVYTGNTSVENEALF